MFEPNTIVVGDRLEIMSQMPDNSVAISITSPPYNLGPSPKHPKGKYRGSFADKLTPDDYANFIWDSIDELLRVTERYVFFNIQALGSNRQFVWDLIDVYRPNLKEIFIWAKTNPPCAGLPTMQGVSANGYEYIFCLTNNPKYDVNKRTFEVYNFSGADYVKNILIYPVNSQNKYSDVHNAVFPLWLPAFFIKNFSFEGDLIFDPFVGVGTTALEALKQNRQYYGCDLSDQYVQISLQRLEVERNQLDLFKGE